MRSDEGAPDATVEVQRPQCGSCHAFFRFGAGGTAGECHAELPGAMPLQRGPMVQGGHGMTIIAGVWKTVPLGSFGCPMHQDWPAYRDSFKPAPDALLVPTQEPEKNGSRLVTP